MPSPADDAIARWGKPPAAPVQDAAEVHVWRASLDRTPEEIEAFRHLLSPDELRRAERFVFEVHRHRFIAGRGCLRSILARYLAIAPADVAFDYGPQDKPQLAAGHATGQPLHFNLAHSDALALFAVTGIGAIGVDLEQIRPDCPAEQIARHFFSDNEVDRLGRLPSEERATAFFHCWARKEAFIKAKGVGLSLPLDQFDVTLAPGEPASLTRTAWDPGEAAQWSLRSLDAGPGFAAALAVRGHGYRLRCWQFERTAGGEAAR
ncbi:MAG: 4'-phosphopantetheinyl transferase superfamily protein [Betaproteobacteria bacterium]|nr:4'-phosphopantetheinyl transferase superfamily protein [Betaproteobacteria bacterium]